MAWSSLTLATDADLSAYEPDMPDVASIPGKSGQSAYDGKRALAKAEIARRLERRGLKPDGILTASQLTHAAVCLELAYIYRAMAKRLESVDGEKANLYQGMFEDEIANVVLDYTEPSTASTQAQQRATITVSRG